MKYLKLTFDIQRCCGGFAARGGLDRAVVLALVPRPGVSDGQHEAPGANFNIIYKHTKVGENSEMCFFSPPTRAPLTLQRLVVGSFPLHWFHCITAHLAPKADRLPLAHCGGPRLHGDARRAHNCARGDAGQTGAKCACKYAYLAQRLTRIRHK